MDLFDLLSEPENAVIRHFHYLGAPYGPDLATVVCLVAAGRLHPAAGPPTGAGPLRSWWTCGNAVSAARPC
ncbi:hypothetical protein ACIBCT_18735 [Streptosporangium sp. NPDC050855]|uniref:hypothetical protein n=1 Tax=Streptosporangium sp. NPDC050855 TaxID=3366194 RepID=UPI0037B2F67E